MVPNLNKNLKNRLQAAQNKSIRICLKLGDRRSIKINEFEKVNCLPIHDRINQCILSSIYNFHANNAPDYMNEVFSHAEYNKIYTLLLSKVKIVSSLNKSRFKTFGPSLWNKLGKSLKTFVFLNAFEHNLKRLPFQERY